MAKRDLDSLLSEKESYDKASQELLDSFKFRRGEIDLIGSMKRTEGWKVMDKKIREELQLRITELVKDDLKIQTLLALLKVADTKRMSAILADEINGILPE